LKTVKISEDKLEEDCIIILRDIKEDVYHQAIFNLFSIYGVICKISIDKEARIALIYFTSNQSASESI